MSGPIAVVVAGVLTGNRGATYAMSDTTRRYLCGFWSLIDEILNSMLFLLIGLEVLVLRFDASLVPMALAAVPIVLLARLIAVALPVTVLSVRERFVKGTIPILTWGGVRGGISVALALSIPQVVEPAIDPDRHLSCRPVHHHRPRPHSARYGKALREPAVTRGATPTTAASHALPL
jgi:Na+:H+ antiporter